MLMAEAVVIVVSMAAIAATTVGEDKARERKYELFFTVRKVIEIL